MMQRSQVRMLFAPSEMREFVVGRPSHQLCFAIPEVVQARVELDDLGGTYEREVFGIRVEHEPGSLEILGSYFFELLARLHADTSCGFELRQLHSWIEHRRYFSELPSAEGALGR